MPPTAIVTSIGTGLCYGHPPTVPIPMTGFVITGSPNKYIETQPAARITDLVMGYCGHIGILVTGFPTVNVNTLQQCIVGSNFTGVFIGIIVTGAATHTTGG